MWQEAVFSDGQPDHVPGSVAEQGNRHQAASGDQAHTSACARSRAV